MAANSFLPTIPPAAMIPDKSTSWQRQYQFDYALVEAGAPFDAYLRQSGRWTLLGRSAAAALYQFHLGFPNNIN